MKTLHLLNGEGTHGGFSQSGVPGDVAVWNEALVAGPVHHEVGSAAYFQERREFLANEYEADEAQFQKVILDEWKKLRTVAQYEELVLWFEHDLFCQVNLLAVMSWLNGLVLTGTRVSLVCIDRHPEVENFRGMGQLQAQHFPDLYDHRVSLEAGDLIVADSLWLAYVGPDPGMFRQMTMLAGAFLPFLPMAVEFHSRRFPDPRDGLNYLERSALTLVAEGVENKRKWVGKLLRSDRYYGLGDTQYFTMLDSMQDLWEETENAIVLTAKGQLVVDGDLVWDGNANEMIGGARRGEWIWDEERNGVYRR